VKLPEPPKPPTPTEEGPHRRLNRTPGGFEAVDQTWRRIAEASVKATLGKSEPEKHTDLLTQIRDGVTPLNQTIQQIKPAVV
jgi:hypothetical protein